jgi:uncharacterized protein (DUF983 family)
MFLRALRRRCPMCGGGGLFIRWLRVAKACPSCGIVVDRGESGYGLGAVWLNLVAAEAVNTAFWVTIAIRTWPDVPWEMLQWIGPLTALLMPIIFYPFAKMLFMALDLCFRPVDAVGPAPARPATREVSANSA